MAENDEEPIGAAGAQDGLERRLESAKKSYDQILNRLWAGNSAGALAAVGVLGSGKISDTRLLLVALSVFLVGIFALGIGAVAALIDELLGLRHREDYPNILDQKPRYIQRPSAEAGLRVSFPNMMALFSALMFIVGTACGFIIAVKGFW